MFGPVYVADSPLLVAEMEFVGPPMSESVFQAVGEGADVNLRWPLPVRSLHFSKGNIIRALCECPNAVSSPSHQRT